MDCRVFRQWVYHFQADEVDSRQREALQGHLNTCEACGRYLELEDSFLRVLKTRLVQVPTPAGLRTRIRASLAEQLPRSRRRRGGWLFSPSAYAAAASVLVTLAIGWGLVGGLPGAFGPEGAGSIAVVKAATVVDLRCDQAGRSPEQQRRCRHQEHFNVLKVAGGGYWTMNLGQSMARPVVLSPEWRGQRVVVEGRYYPELGQIELTRLREDSSFTI